MAKEPRDFEPAPNQIVILQDEWMALRRVIDDQRDLALAVLGFEKPDMVDLYDFGSYEFFYDRLETDAPRRLCVITYIDLRHGRTERVQQILEVWKARANA